eukprot:13469795-Heterocapsa_arctica.AAC.1
MRSGSNKTCRRAIAAFPSLRQFWQEDGAGEHNPEGLRQLITALAAKDIEQLLAEIDQDVEMAEWRKIGKREALRRRATAWADRGRKFSSFA